MRESGRDPRGTGVASLQLLDPQKPDQPHQGPLGRYSSAEYMQTGTHKFQLLMKDRGQTVGTRTYEAAVDGKSLTVTVERHLSSGRKSTSVYRYTR
jgi:hypothetical protein